MRIPRATYRLQLHAGFDLAAARDLVPYLAALGVSDLYASPLFTARAGSLHGYDVTDLERVNPALGGEQALEALSNALRAAGMGLLLDWVPNHMAADAANPWWRSVLTYGPASPFAGTFDVTWYEPYGPDADDRRLLLPVLGDAFGDVMERGELGLTWDDDGYAVTYFDHRFPITPATYAPLLAFGLESLAPAARLDPAVAALGALLEQARRCPPVPLAAPASPAVLHAVYTAGEAVRAAVRTFRAHHRSFAERVDENLRRFAGTPGDPASFGRLEAFLDAQIYRLADWRLASGQGNYRRFFDINELAGLRVEHPAVFEAVHRRLFALAGDGVVQGVRVDHVDGLYDPLGYLTQLGAGLAAAAAAAPYVVVEKILGPDEAVPADWPVAGTTGYDFLSACNGVFADPRGVAYLDRSYAEFTQSPAPFGEVVRQGKALVIHELFEGELAKLARRLGAIAARDRRACDLPPRELREALAQITACLPVYRTYTRGEHVGPVDRAYLAEAVALARARTSPQLASAAAFDFVARVLLLEALPAEPADRRRRVAFVRAWQQFSGPAMAKGLEDTAFFRHTRLVSLNAVGGTPVDIERPPGVESFHAHAARIAKTHPATLSTTSTHDTKRSADVRARINVVSELPFAWARAFRRWRRMNAPLKRTVGGREAPDAHEEILLYQTLIGAWPWAEAERPAFTARLADHATKALREAKVNSSWRRQDEAYEAAVTDFVRQMLDPAVSAPFLEDFGRFEARIAFFGAWNALGQVVLKAASPGVPDFYQGEELWDFSLTDPDNRRPVDFALRRRLLQELGAGEPLDEAAHAGLLADWRSGRIKLYVTRRALALRQAHPTLFASGVYVPLPAAGGRAKNVIAFARRLGARWVLACVPRLTTQLTRAARFPLGRGAWGGTMLKLPPGAPRRWRHAFTGEDVAPAAVTVDGGSLLPLRALVGAFPVALLEGA